VRQVDREAPYRIAVDQLVRLTGERINSLKAKRAEAEDLLSQLDTPRSASPGQRTRWRFWRAYPTSAAHRQVPIPKLRRVFDAFRVRMEIDRNAGEIKLKALVSSAFS
jgi:hypothetical protein